MQKPLFRTSHTCLLFCLLFACQPKDRYGDQSILRINLPDLNSVDPAFARSIDNVNACKQLFDGLVELDDELNLKPSIARSWEIKDSARTYRFILRDDVYYHPNKKVFGEDSSRTVKASDFVYSFNRLIEKEILSPGKWVMNKVKRREDGSLDITAINDTVLEIRLSEAFPAFMGILSMQYCSVVPPEALETEGFDFLDHPLGTGAFKFKYWKKSGKLVLLKHSDYFQKDASAEQLPYLDAISISFIRDQEVVFLNFLKGELDFISGLKGSYKDELLDQSGALRAEYKDKLEFVKLPYLNTEYLGFQLDSDSIQAATAIQSKDLRKAISYAIDKEKMLKYLRNDIGTPAYAGFIPIGLTAFDKEAKYGYSYDLDSSEFYFNRFNQKHQWNAEEEPIILGTTSEYMDICEFIQHQLNERGIKVKIEVNPPATNNELIAFGKLPTFRKSWVADYPDAENYLSLFLSRNFSPSGPNYTHFSSSTYDSLFSVALQLDDEAKRNVYYRRLDSMIMAEVAVLPLFYDQQVHFISPNISNFRVNPMNHLMLKYAKKLP
ncbi:MAG: ABC transporter substrate-binding protein [Flavobacteriales bacterium]|nr:ABC transporter substrate-binding protein [Flavobacteriales bacterium]